MKMDTNLKNKLSEIKSLVKEGKKDEALKEVDTLLSAEEYKPYEDALKKIKVDIIYALNLERIDPELGKKAYEKVATELDSAVGIPVKTESKTDNAEKAVVKKQPAPKPPVQQTVTTPPATLTPLPPLPVPVVQVPKELVEFDPYDIDSLDIEHEIGPVGFINDLRRTLVSIADPFLPLKMLEKQAKKKRE
jgi:hypothetical protein